MDKDIDMERKDDSRREQWWLIEGAVVAHR
jgi:hypothetical protein